MRGWQATCPASAFVHGINKLGINNSRTNSPQGSTLGALGTMGLFSWLSDTESLCAVCIAETVGGSRDVLGVRT